MARSRNNKTFVTSRLESCPKYPRPRALTFTQCYHSWTLQGGPKTDTQIIFGITSVIQHQF